MPPKYLKFDQDAVLGAFLDKGGFGFNAMHPDFNAKNDGTIDDSTALQNVLNAGNPSGLGSTGPGGTAVLPAGGSYKHSSGLILPPNVSMEGNGFRSQLNYTGAGMGVSIGTGIATLGYRGRIANLIQVINHINSIGFRLIGTQGVSLRDVYIEGPTYNYPAGTLMTAAQFAARTNVGVQVDGGNISAFFNTFDSVETNHCHTGFRIMTSGAIRATCQTFINCTAFGDYITTVNVAGVPTAGLPADGTSVGLKIDTGQGDGSVWIGGNIENCGIGMDLDGNGFTSLGCRFEIGSGVAIRFGPNARNNRILGCMDLARSQIVDNSPPGSNNVVEIQGEAEVRFTPALSGATGSITMGTSSCYFSRVGNRVTVWGVVNVAGVAAPTGQLVLAGLPFPVRNDPGNAAAGSLRADGLAATATSPVQCYALPNTSNLVFEKFAAGAAANLASDVVSGTRFNFNVTYAV